ncbi:MULTISPECIES: orotidine-5'-phosphate decarboxylase [Cryobacterium]|uniref:Orotidine-5'-phosphate decarboxylase n=1 Tax=Cryobacterium breve TaxID=1259258 RepID=A0ABY2IXH2_9MICO|nr:MULTISPECIES: orotidine-5'-phosphate decarboxylase [Cryobacterium]TFC96996.1 orotidine-5'-phosphate decarboxylase [Cryobacterium sp. TmT3-12]TFC97208.1 orotidine-5'-phosphate decarboxylase [Cryobacterium breve]
MTGAPDTSGSTSPVGALARPSFGDRLRLAFDLRGPVCVGIDPHSWLLGDWGLPDTAGGAESFGRQVVAAAAGQVGLVKPQVAFYERFGSAGYVALERVLTDARAAGLLTIADVKRGDLGTSAEAYGEAWLSAGSALEVDAITVNAYMGVGSLDPVFTLAGRSGKGLFLLAATSNPEAATVQRAVLAEGPQAGRTVAGAVFDAVSLRNARSGADTFGSFGVVLGATLDLTAFGLDLSAAPALGLTPILAPGFGHQGAQVADLRNLYGGYAQGVIVSESRSVLSAGPDRIRQAIARRVVEAGAARG